MKEPAPRSHVSLSLYTSTTDFPENSNLSSYYILRLGCITHGIQILLERSNWQVDFSATKQNKNRGKEAGFLISITKQSSARAREGGLTPTPRHHRQYRFSRKIMTREDLTKDLEFLLSKCHLKSASATINSKWSLHLHFFHPSLLFLSLFAVTFFFIYSILFRPYLFEA
jgi:hypothetical protein